MPLCLFMVSRWPMFLCLLEVQVAHSEGESTLGNWCRCQKTGLSGSRHYPERDICSTDSSHSMPAFWTICLFMLHDTRTRTHTHTHACTSMHWLAVKPKEEREASEIKCLPYSRGWRSTRWSTIVITPWTGPCRGKLVPTCPCPSAVPAFMLDE